MDLVFPHHENEIAQSRSLGHDFARIWMHNGMLSMGGEEMHKSAGNAVLLSEVLDRFGRETVLLFFMTGQWRKPLDFSEATLTAARRRPRRSATLGETRSRGDWRAFASVLEDDFNTPAALAILHEWARTGALDELRRGLDVFGLAGLAERAQAPPEVVTLADARVAAPRATSPRPTGFVTRSPSAVGGAGRGLRLRARAALVTRDLVYGRNAVREVPAAGARCSSCGRASAVAGLEWLRRRPTSAGAQGARAHRGGRHLRSPGRRRLVRAVPVRGRLGARCGGAAADLLPRPGDGPAEPRRRRPERGGRRRDGRRRPRARRERCDAGRVPGIRGAGSTFRSPSSPTSPAIWRTSRATACGPMRPQPTASSGSGTPISRTAPRSSSARRGKVSGRSSGGRATRRSRSRSRRESNPST